MKTAYYETQRFIRHQGNVVDLAAYREKLAAVSGDSFSTDHSSELCADHRDDLHPGLTLVEPRARRSDRRQRSHRAVLSFWLDVCASGAVLVFAVVAAIQFLHLF